MRDAVIADIETMLRGAAFADTTTKVSEILAGGERGGAVFHSEMVIGS
jgi:hypothetical protein